MIDKYQRHQARKKRVRAKLAQRQDRPRLHVFRSNQHTYAQIIDDQTGVTLVSAAETELDKAGSRTKTQRAVLIGDLIARKAKTKKITHIRFDRGAYKYHGRVRALAEAARKGGLDF